MGDIEQRAETMKAVVYEITDPLLLIQRYKDDEDKWYNVDLEAETCDCPYFQYNEGVCKHIIRGQNAVEDGETVKI